MTDNWSRIFWTFCFFDLSRSLLIFLLSPTASGDYSAFTAMTITFPAGQTSVMIPVDTTEDEIAELLEQFTATLSNPSEGLIVGDDDVATIEIGDDDCEYIPFTP